MTPPTPPTPATVTCSRCEGDGILRRWNKTAECPEHKPCPTCHGTGKVAAPQSQKGGDAECSTVPLAGNTTCPDVVVESNAAPDVPPVADAADFMCHDCKRPMSQCICYEASRRQIKPPATPSGTPRTDAAILEYEGIDRANSFLYVTPEDMRELERQTQRDAERIAELEAALREAATVFDDLDAVMWDRSGCPVQYTDAQNAANDALAARKEGK